VKRKPDPMTQHVVARIPRGALGAERDKKEVRTPYANRSGLYRTRRAFFDNWGELVPVGTRLEVVPSPHTPNTWRLVTLDTGRLVTSFSESSLVLLLERVEAAEGGEVAA
jgi:hypothetical protein